MLAPRTAPLWVSAVRLLPAGAILVGWAARQGRPQPSGRMAWVAIAAFALADGACFQVPPPSPPAMLPKSRLTKLRSALAFQHTFEQTAKVALSIIDC